MNFEQMGERLKTIADATGSEWEDYGVPSVDDLTVAVAGMVDYLDGVEGDASIELPKAGIMVVRNDDGLRVWVSAGSVEATEVASE